MHRQTNDLDLLCNITCKNIIEFKNLKNASKKIETLDNFPDRIWEKICSEYFLNNWEEKDAEAYLDRFGNKIVFEKKLNIQAGNGYFGKKKDRYSTSKIAVVLELSNYPKSDWLKEDIEKREGEFKSRIFDFLKKHLNLPVE